MEVIGVIAAVLSFLREIVKDVTGLRKKRAEPKMDMRTAPSRVGLADMLLEGVGKYEWQWAGQNWLGHIVFTKNGQGQIKAKVSVHKVFKRQKSGEVTIITGAEVMKSKEQGGAVLLGDVIIYGDHVELRNLVVEKNTFGWMKARDIDIEGIEVTGSPETETLSVLILRPILAFAGELMFTTAEGKEERGDMVLVKHSASIFPSASSLRTK